MGQPKYVCAKRYGATGQTTDEFQNGPLSAERRSTRRCVFFVLLM
jgi:hypothetical protein